MNNKLVGGLDVSAAILTRIRVPGVWDPVPVYKPAFLLILAHALALLSAVGATPWHRPRWLPSRAGAFLSPDLLSRPSQAQTPHELRLPTTAQSLPPECFVHTGTPGQQHRACS